MKQSHAFSGQTLAQREIIAHWKSIRREGRLPLRAEINPGTLRAHLSSISMIEVDADGEARFRLIGSKLHSIFGGDMRGRNLSELASDKAAMWMLGLSSAINHGRPVGGIVNRAHDRHAWLRVPLDSGIYGKSLVLCHDMLLSQDEVDGHDPFGLFSTPEDSLAA